jgi:hypothetical protein
LRSVRARRGLQRVQKVWNRQRWKRGPWGKGRDDGKKTGGEDAADCGVQGVEAGAGGGKGRDWGQNTGGGAWENRLKTLLGFGDEELDELTAGARSSDVGRQCKRGQGVGIGQGGYMFADAHGVADERRCGCDGLKGRVGKAGTAGGSERVGRCLREEFDDRSRQRCCGDLR